LIGIFNESTGSNATTFNTIANMQMGTKGLRLDVHWGFMQRQVPHTCEK
jgi:hypothetical protein